MPQASLGPVGQVDGPQRAVDAIARVGHLVEVGEAREVLGHAQAQVQAGRLGHDRDPAADLHSVLGRERESGDRCRARGRRDESAERPHGRRLPGAVRPEETEDLAVADLEGDVLERDPVAEALAQVVDGQRRGAAASRRVPPRLRASRSHAASRCGRCSLVPRRRSAPDRICRRRWPGRGAAPQLPDEPPDQVDHHWYRRAVPGWIRVARRSGPRMTMRVSTSTPARVISGMAGGNSCGRMRSASCAGASAGPRRSASRAGPRPPSRRRPARPPRW